MVIILLVSQNYPLELERRHPTFKVECWGHMIIDKTTGRGCAWSIASKTIARKLVAEGIEGKVISQKSFPNSYELLQVIEYGEAHVCVVSQRVKELIEKELWVPSFIDTKIWAQAVNRFQAYKRLEENVEKYLLPEMDTYLQNIPDSELISMTRDFLMAHNVINVPIRQRSGKTYYFDENEVYAIDKDSMLFPYEKKLKFSIFTVRGETCFNMNVWSKAVSQFEVGMTLKECLEVFVKTDLSHNEKHEQSPLQRLVQYIVPPIYEREPENQNEATFDRIRVIVGLPRYQFSSWEALRNEVKKYRRKIYQQVVQRLEKDRRFQKYGVPLNFLRLSNVTLCHNFSIEFIFELKELEMSSPTRYKKLKEKQGELNKEKSI